MRRPVPPERDDIQNGLDVYADERQAMPDDSVVVPEHEVIYQEYMEMLLQEPCLSG